MPMKRDTHDIARESFNFWTGIIPGAIMTYKPVATYALLSMQDGETSMLWPFPVGDHGRAHGPFQNQKVRIDAIRDALGIDLMNPELSNLDGLRAADWELRKAEVYHQVGPILDILTTMEACVAILVAMFEQSFNKPRDIVRRYNLAHYWAGQFGPGAQV
jgi:hypothetical protein